MAKVILSLGRNSGYYSYGGGGNEVSISDSNATNPYSVAIQVGSYDGFVFNYRYKLDGGGGDDSLTGGVANDYLVGGAGGDTLSGGAGNDLIFGGKDLNEAFAPRVEKYDNLSGDAAADLDFDAGDDTIFAGAGSTKLPTYIFGDAGGNATGDLRLGDDKIYGGSGILIAYGDVRATMMASETEGINGGNDTLYGGTGDSTMRGDASSLVGYDLAHLAVGGDDVLFAGGLSNYVTGDADNMYGFSLGGDDQITGGGAGSTNMLVGDSWQIESVSKGGNDTITGGLSDSNSIYGDAGALWKFAAGGDDVLTGGQGDYNEIFGDAEYALTSFLEGIVSDATGGDDLIYSGNKVGGTNIACGDFNRVIGSNTSAPVVNFGDDVIIAGRGSDQISGDLAPDKLFTVDVYGYPLGVISEANLSGGTDTHVFFADRAGGIDAISDFDLYGNAGDTIALVGFTYDGGGTPVSSWEALQSSGYYSYDAGADTTKIMVGSWTLTVNGQLDSADFIYAFTVA